MPTWREHATPIIAKVIADNKGKTPKEIKKALHDAYPYGERARHPYKIWCDEVKEQMGTKVSNLKPQPENQIDLFEMIHDVELKTDKK